MARGWQPSGVDPSLLGLAGQLAPTLVAGPTINVTAGACWLDGHYAELATPASVPATANGLLVVRFTPADNHAELLYRDAATTCTQTLATWELPIAQMIAGALRDIRWFANTSGELAWAQNTGTVTFTSAHTAASPATVIDMPSVYFDGATYEAEATVLAMGYVSPTTGSPFQSADVWIDGATGGTLLRSYQPSGGCGWGRLRITPTPGCHQLRLRGYLASAATGGAFTLSTLRIMRL